MLLDVCDRYRDAEIGGTITGEKEQGKKHKLFCSREQFILQTRCILRDKGSSIHPENGVPLTLTHHLAQFSAELFIMFASFFFSLLFSIKRDMCVLNISNSVTSVTHSV